MHFYLLFRFSKTVARWSIFLLFFAVSVAQAGPTVGIWVEAEGRNRPFESPEDFRGFLDFVTKHRFTDVYCQIYREGKAWFPSKLADDAPFEKGRRAGFDPLGDTINVAHGQGKRVHAWINVLRVAKEVTAPGLLAIGKRAFLIDNYGRSLLDYSSLGVPPGSRGGERLDTVGAWLDPSSPEVRHYVVSLVREILGRYPEVDGIHLDMIRYPYVSGGGNISFSYGPDAEARFRAETGKEVPGKGGLRAASVASQSEWNVWRRAQLTRLVYDIRQEISAQFPEKELTAAVFAGEENAQNHTFQDWHSWVRGGALSAAIPMNYTKDYVSYSENVRYAVEAGDANRMRIGIGAWLMLNNPDLLVAQAQLAKKYGAGGVVLFSFSNLYSPRGEQFLEQTLPRLLD